jgi:hypothetical protein
MQDSAMKKLLSAAAAIALLAAAGPASAQVFQSLRPVPPPPGYPSMDVPSGPQSTITPQPSEISAAPSWMQDDGSSSDYPIHNPGDRSGDPLNSQYQGGIPTAPGHGFPAYPGQGE